MHLKNGSSNYNVQSRGNILVIDDEPSIIFIICRFLEKHRYNTTSVTRAAEALDLVQTQTFDLVTCDINMPGMNGLDFLNTLKRIDPGLASVVITGSSGVGMAVRAMESGALGFVTKPFSESELIESVETAIEQARMIRETTTMKLYTPMLESASMALLNALEAKDSDSQGHSQRVAENSQKLAYRLGLSQDEIVQVFMGGLFHDIGKIGISDAILRKAGPLTLQEQQEMIKHPQIGAKIIGTVEELIRASDIILHHHERYDGTGYPDGLQGEAIPIGSRIVAVADVYEDMISKRPYADVMSHEQAIDELRRNSGTQFDPKIVDLFIESMPQHKSPD